MCRHLAYLGPPRALASLLVDAPHSLRHQSEAPRHQREGAVNRDGWGVGWWSADGIERYRTATPMSEDDGFPHGDVNAGAVIAAARHASPHSALVEAGNAPFTDGRWLFSLNGYVAGFFDGDVGRELRALLSPAAVAALEGDSDSEIVFALVRAELDRGLSPGQALAATLATVLARTEGRINLLLGDGERIWATTWGNSLFTLAGVGLAAGGVLVASEPLDDDPMWAQVPDGSLVDATGAGLTIHPLASIEGAA